ncbi:MAG: 50S ribosomal protein L31e [Candidatus Bathyarchaeia archaeon]
MDTKKDETNPEVAGETVSEKTAEAIEREEETVKVSEEQKKVEEKKKKEDEEEIVEERVYTIPLGRSCLAPRKKTTPKAVRIIKSFVLRHMKVDGDSVKISNAVNEKLWRRGIEKPPRKIKVRITKNVDGIVTVHPAEGE